MRGVTSRTALYRAGILIAKPLFPIFKALSPNSVTTSVNVGRAMINVVKRGYPQPHIEVKDINALAA